MQYRKLNELKKLPNNPRIIRDKQFKTLRLSLQATKMMQEQESATVYRLIL